VGIISGSSAHEGQEEPLTLGRADAGTPETPPLTAHSRAANTGSNGADGSQLARTRDELAAQVTELHWDLGGLTYEMAIRDHFRLDLLVRRAAVLQERDAELAEVERLLRMEQDGVAGNCPACAAPHSRGALYCWQCGATLMERLPSTAVAAEEQSAVAMDALLGPSEPGEMPGLTDDDLR
jgi:hypothetical protein